MSNLFYVFVPDAKEAGTDNRNIVDDGKSQKLTRDDIETLKEKGMKGQVHKKKSCNYTSLTLMTWVGPGQTDPCSNFGLIQTKPVNAGWSLVMTHKIQIGLGSQPRSDAYQLPHMLVMGRGPLLSPVICRLIFSSPWTGLPGAPAP